MGRPRSAPGGRPVVVSVRLSAAEAASLDAHRGSVDRGAFFRWLLTRHIREAEPLPKGEEVVSALRAQHRSS